MTALLRATPIERKAAGLAAAFVVLGARGDPRVAAFQEALAQAGQAPARLIDYRDVCTDAGALDDLPHGAVLRIESPGRDFEVTRALLLAGVAASEAATEAHLDAEQMQRLGPDKGRILAPRQVYRGLCAGLDRVAARLAERPDVTPLLDTELIKLAFDKSRCHAALGAHGVRVPRTLPPPRTFDDLLAQMRDARLGRVFVKLQHGSAASGIVALAQSPRGMSAWTTAEVVEARDGVRLYNSRAVRRLDGVREIAQLIDALIALGVHVEAWIPKAGSDGATCDLRVLMVDGEPAHMVLRRSRTPFTNLHLLNERADATALTSRMSVEARDDLLATCRKAAKVFGRSLHVGLDVAVTADLKRAYVLEANAFGDLIKGVELDGLDTYAWQLSKLPGWLERRADA